MLGVSLRPPTRSVCGAWLSSALLLRQGVLVLTSLAILGRGEKGRDDDRWEPE